MNIPYFDLIFDEFAKDSSPVAAAFGENTHWGYYTLHQRPDISLSGFQEAARALNKHLIESASLKEGFKILDVGCGFGGTIKEINNQHSRVDLTGLNIDPRQVEHANKLVRPLAKNSNQIQFIVGDACQLPFENEKFDRVMAVECAFHFPSRKVFLEEAYRVLKPGGRLIMSDFVTYGPALPFLLAAGLFAYGDIQKTFGKTQGVYSLLHYKFLAKKAGFRVSKVNDITRNTLPTYDFIDGLIQSKLLEGKNFKHFTRANSFLKLAAKTGMTKYLCFVFEKDR